MNKDSPIQTRAIGGGNDLNNNEPTRKRDKFLDFFGLPKSKNKGLKNKASNQTLSTQVLPLAAESPSTISKSCNSPMGNSTSDNSSTPEDRPLTPLLAEVSSISDIFSENPPKPVIKTELPTLMDRIEVTQQLVYCNRLLIDGQSTILRANAAKGPSDESVSETKGVSSSESQDSTFQGVQAWEPDEAERAWIKAIGQDPLKRDHLSWLVTKVVQEFAKDDIKGPSVISEVVILGSVLDRDTYRSLLSCFITEVSADTILDVALLQGIVQLVEVASPGYLEDDDLVKTLAVLRQHLQGTHRSSSEFLYQILIAISRILDVMVNSSVRGVNRIEQHLPLVTALTELKGGADTTDPILHFQVDYALQACQYIPDDESTLQAVLRFGGGLAMAALGAASVCKLDPGNLFDSLDTLRQAAGQAYEVTKSMLEGMEASQKGRFGAMQSLLHGIRKGTKHEWYLTLLAVRTFIQEGRFIEFNRTVCEAQCRDERAFQLGVCQILGEVAMNPLWDLLTRQHAVDFLGALFRIINGWRQHLEVKQCIFVLLTQLSGLQDATVKDHALVVLQDLDLEGTTTSAATYPLKSRLLVPESSPLLIRAQKIQYLEHDLRRVRLQRLEEARMHIYIPPMAKANLQAPDKDLFLLMDNVQEFLSSDRQVMLILGDSGGGKSTFNKHLEAKLLRSYIIGGWIPLFINLPPIDRPVKELMTEQLKEHGFSEAQIQELKQHRRFIVICDGYDESQLTTNLHTTNLFNRPGQWKVKMVITCRTQYLGPNYRNRFMPQGGDHYDCPAPNLFDEAVIAPFSKEQIESYVEQYVPLEPRPWVTEDYMNRLTAIPNLLDLVRNPFLLSLALEALPGVTKDKQELSKIEITRVQLYDTFVDHWLGVNQRRLERNNALSKEDQDTLRDLIDDGFIRCGSEYLRRLAASIFKEQEGNPVVQYTHRQDKASWKAAFFGTDPEIRLLRESSPLTRTGNQYRFFHRSMLEYFFSRVIYNPIKIGEKDLGSQRKTWTPTLPPLDANGPLFQTNLLVEPSIIQFLCDRVKLDQAFEQQLRAVIDQSKTDATATTAATNAISILVRAGTLFNGADLRGIKIPGADLSGGQFDSAQFQEADLSRVNLSRSWLRQADLSSAQIEGALFGELPYLQMGNFMEACAYSPDGRMLAVGGVERGEGGCIRIYDTSFWTEVCRIRCAAAVGDVAFSPDSQTIVSGEVNGTVRLWDCTNGQELFVLEGHSDWTTSVAFSPCGKQIASASHDRTVRLWDSQTGKKLFTLEGHTGLISSIKYSPKGERLVSGGWDATIRFWDTMTGEPGMVLRSSLEDVFCLGYSPDGQWIVSAHREGGFQLWNSRTGEPGPMLYGHTGYVSGAEFSPNGQWIVSCSSDGTVKLWDALTGNLITSLDGHMVTVYDVAFSPDGLQIASSALDETVRLWDVESSWLSIDDQAQVGLASTVTYSHDGRSVLAINRHCMIRKWDAETGACESVPFEFPDRRSITLMGFSSDGRQMITNCDDDSLRLYDSQTGAAEPVLKGYSEDMTELAYSPCRRWIAFADKRTVRLWDLNDTDQRVLHVDTEGATEGPIEALTFSPTGHQLAVGYRDGAVRVIDPKTQKTQFTLHLENRGVAALSFSPSEKQLAIGTAIGPVLWDFYQTTSALQLGGPSGYVPCIAYSPCGQWVASGCQFEFSTVLLWHLRSKEEEVDKEKESWSCVSVVGGFFQQVRELCWNPAVPMEFVTASDDGSIRVWRVSSDGKGGSVVVRMLWGTNLRLLCVTGLTFKDTTGLRPIYQKLLLQRGAIDEDEEDEYSGLIT